MNKEHVPRTATHDLPDRPGDRKLTWDELIAIAAGRGNYMAPMTDISHSGHRADFFCYCLNERFPMYESELTETDRKHMAGESVFSLQGLKKT